jgi:hypothetical protein
MSKHNGQPTPESHSALVNPERGLRIRLQSIRERETKLPGPLGQRVEHPWLVLTLTAVLIGLLHWSGIAFQF